MASAGRTGIETGDGTGRTRGTGTGAGAGSETGAATDAERRAERAGGAEGMSGADCVGGRSRPPSRAVTAGGAEWGEEEGGRRGEGGRGGSRQSCGC